MHVICQQQGNGSNATVRGMQSACNSVYINNVLYIANGASDDLALLICPLFLTRHKNKECHYVQVKIQILEL